MTEAKQQSDAVILGQSCGMHPGGVALMKKERWKGLFPHSMGDMKRAR